MQICNGLPQRQRGAVLLLLVSLLVILGAGLYFSSHSSNAPRLAQAKDIGDELRHARQELVAFALAFDQLYPGTSGPGHLPCPDTDHDGNPETPCGSPAVGRLPATAPAATQVVLFSNYEAQEDRRFWYAVADPFRANPAGVVNSNAPMLTADGRDAVAVVIEPGERTGAQDRSVDGVNDVAISNYLEDENADGDADFATVGNDRLLSVAPGDLFPLIQRLVAQEVGDALRSYRSACGVYPAPVPYSDPESVTNFDSDTTSSVFEGLFPSGTAFPADWGSGCAPALNLSSWITTNDWARHVYYAIAPSDPCTPGTDCLTILNSPVPNDDKQGILVFPGTALGSQTRLSGTPGVADYFEGENATASDGIYESGEWGSGFNDEIYVVN